MLVLRRSSRLNSELHGSKAIGLQRLLRAGLRIPTTLVVAAGETPTPDAIKRFVGRLEGGRSLMIRSSSRHEDSPDRSLAGCFMSEQTSERGIRASIARVRAHAATLEHLNAVEDSVPVLIQPVLTGWGGVYLGEKDLTTHSLTLSRLGVSAVTSGRTAPFDLLPVAHPVYQRTLKICREAHAKLGGQVDIELVLNGRGVVFLQCRPLTRKLVPELDAGLSEHFPSPLRRLVGELWERVLSETLGIAVSYRDGFLFGLVDDAPGPISPKPSAAKLKAAHTFYRRRLFPSWDKRLRDLRDECARLDPSAGWWRARGAWKAFLDEYFNNPHEPTARSAAAHCRSGAGISPTLRRRMKYLSALHKIVFGSGHRKPTAEILNSPVMQEYLAEFGCEFFGDNDLSAPTAAEAPELFLASLPEPTTAVRVPMSREGLLRQVAWLVEEDNIYKSRFAAEFRHATMRLADALVHEGKLGASDDIWDCGLHEVERGEPVRKRLGSAKKSNNGNRQIHLGVSQPAIILAPGEAVGLATRTQPITENSVLVRSVIDARDYPALMAAAGGVVAFGSPGCHAALFARDIGKPLYRCPVVVSGVPEAASLRLCSQPPRIELTTRRPR